MNNSVKIGLIKVTLLSILIALSGMAAIASADTPLPPNKFAGSVVINGVDAFPEIVIDAFIDGDSRGSITVESSGKYGDFDGLKYLDVTGNDSDDGKTVTFTVCGATADQTAVWTANAGPQILNLTAVDDEAPTVSGADANPASIVAGSEMTQLNVTVTDGCSCTVGTVTVNLFAIGGSAVQAMTRVGATDVYSVVVNATEDTGAYCLQVNASDVFGNYDTSVCIALNVTTDTGLPKDGNINGLGGVTLSDAIYLAKHVAETSGYETLHADGNINGLGGVSLSDAIYLAKYVAETSGYETLYPD